MSMNSYSSALLSSMTASAMAAMASSVSAAMNNANGGSGTAGLHFPTVSTLVILIHLADPHSQPVVITVVRTSTFHNCAKENNFQVKTGMATGIIVGLAEWIMDDTYLVKLHNCSNVMSFFRIPMLPVKCWAFPRSLLNLRFAGLK